MAIFQVNLESACFKMEAIEVCIITDTKDNSLSAFVFELIKQPRFKSLI